MKPTVETGEGAAQALDHQDSLAGFREHFYLEPGMIYLDGNSLGLLSVQAEVSVLRVLREWKSLAVGGWMAGEPPWYTLAEAMAEQVAPLVGAAAEEVAIANSTTVNLHQLLSTLYRPTEERFAILADPLNFPSDLYAIDSHLRLRGLEPSRYLRLVSSRDGLTLDEEQIVAAMTDDVALVVLPSVLYSSGQLLDMERLTLAARERSILIGFDCSHSIGAVPHAFDAWGVDFAFWCHYKYLNSGPGAIGGLYLNRRHFGRPPGMAGWFSSRKSAQFDMSPTLDFAPDTGALQIGTPPVLSLAPLQGSLELVHQAGMERIRRKSLDLTEYLMHLIDGHLAAFGFRVVNPREEARRGGHVSLVHAEATRICKALKSAHVVPDFRPPNIIRLAPAALYNSFVDCYQAVMILKRIMENGVYRNYEMGRDMVA